MIREAKHSEKVGRLDREAASTLEVRDKSDKNVDIVNENI